MQVALFGAAFDPPHLGHLAVLKAVLQQRLADEVWLVPAKSHPFGKPLSDPSQRLVMLQLLVASMAEQIDGDVLANRVKIEPFELDNPGISYTHVTLTILSQRYAQHTFSFVMGSDNLARFDEWGGQEVLAQFPFWVYPRAGYPTQSFQPLKPNMRVIQNVPEIDISSTLVRQNQARGDSINQLVPKSIAEYITRQKLYSWTAAT